MTLQLIAQATMFKPISESLKRDEPPFGNELDLLGVIESHPGSGVGPAKETQH